MNENTQAEKTTRRLQTLDVQLNSTRLTQATVFHNLCRDQHLKEFVTLCVRAIVRLRCRERAYLGVQAGMRYACDGKAERTTLPTVLDATA